MHIGLRKWRAIGGELGEDWLRFVSGSSSNIVAVSACGPMRPDRCLSGHSLHQYPGPRPCSGARNANSALMLTRQRWPSDASVWKKTAVLRVYCSQALCTGTGSWGLTLLNHPLIISPIRGHWVNATIENGWNREQNAVSDRQKTSQL